MLTRIQSAVAVLCVAVGLLSPPAVAQQIAVETILPPLSIDAEGDLNVFAMPFDYRDGQIFTVHVEVPDKRDLSLPENANLHTVVRHGVRGSDGLWSWRENRLEKRTLRDAYHTQASIALDRNGHVHVAYNMHNMPWQYSVSKRAFDIEAFDFRGEALKTSELLAVKLANQTPFPGDGRAAIPGNQITYPMFFHDRQGDLFISYRFALRPSKPWKQRAFAGGVARYDVQTRRWQALGAAPFPAEGAALPALVFDPEYKPYLITLAFDSANRRHAVWNWRRDEAGADTVRPSHAMSQDGRNFTSAAGSKYPLPIGFAHSEAIVDTATPFYAPKSLAVLPDGKILAVLHPVEGGRQLVVLDNASGNWSVPTPMPASASEIIVDRHGRIWAFASGLKVFMRASMADPWQKVGDIGSSLCSPKVRYMAAESRFVVHAKTCDNASATIVSFRR